MRLIGMLDSPYVRRVAISLHGLGVPFEHAAISVFSTFKEFHAINPVVQAPTLVCDDGEVLMDSSLILHYIEATQAHGRSLWSANPQTLQHQLRTVGLALAACDKGVQMVYERNLRPAAAQYEPWLERVRGQLLAACAGLEAEVRTHPRLFAAPLSQASISAAVAWEFIQSMLAHLVPAAAHPHLQAHAENMQGTQAFQNYPPVGPGVVAAADPQQ